MKKYMVWLMILAMCCTFVLSSCESAKVEESAAPDEEVAVTDSKTESETPKSEEQTPSEEKTELNEEEKTSEEKPSEEKTEEQDEEKTNQKNAPAEEHNYVYQEGYQVNVTPKKMQQDAVLVLKAKPIKKISERMTNPDESIKTEYGTLANRNVTEYEFEIIEILKGTYEGKTISVKFFEEVERELTHFGCSAPGTPAVVRVTAKRPDFVDGKEYLLCITDQNEIGGFPEWTHGYHVLNHYTGEDQIEGCLEADENGEFTKFHVPGETVSYEDQKGNPIE